jgi:hypothetical protein
MWKNCMHDVLPRRPTLSSGQHRTTPHRTTHDTPSPPILRRWHPDRNKDDPDAQKTFQAVAEGARWACCRLWRAVAVCSCSVAGAHAHSLPPARAHSQPVQLTRCSSFSFSSSFARHGIALQHTRFCPTTRSDRSTTRTGRRDSSKTNKGEGMEAVALVSLIVSLAVLVGCRVSLTIALFTANCPLAFYRAAFCKWASAAGLASIVHLRCCSARPQLWPSTVGTARPAAPQSGQSRRRRSRHATASAWRVPSAVHHWQALGAVLTRRTAARTQRPCASHLPPQMDCQHPRTFRS